MTIILDNGNSGTKHVTGAVVGGLYAGLAGGECYVFDTGDGLAATLEDANTVRISSGDLIMYGRHVHIPTGSHEDVTITNGVSGYNQHTLICARYSMDTSTTDNIEAVGLVAIDGARATGDAADPEVPQDSVLDGATEAYFPLYRIVKTGVSVGTPVKLFETSPTAASLQEQIDSVRESVSRIAVRSGDTERYSVTNGTYYSKTVPFGAEFEEPPMVSVAPSYNGVHAYRIELSSRTKTSFTFGFIASVTGNVSFAWQAIGRLA